MPGAVSAPPAAISPDSVPRRTAPARPGRILLISMDTVRADRVAGYGRDDLTPALARIGREGVVFSRTYAASNYTLPSTMSILTGLDPKEHGVVNEMAEIGADAPTLAQRLRRVGYRTQAFHEGGYLDPRFGFARGFDDYRSREGEWIGMSLWGVLDWLRAQGDDPYFLFLQTYHAHWPYKGFEDYRRRHPERGLPSDAEIADLRRRYPLSRENAYVAPRELPADLIHTCTLYNQLASSFEAFLGCGDKWLHPNFAKSGHFEADRAALLDAYGASIGRIDRAIDQIRKTLVELGQWEDTLLVVTSDHGEGFFEHGLYMHDYNPYDEVMRVPLVISYPEKLRFAPRHRVDGLAWHLDIQPTILGLAGLPAPGHAGGLDLSRVAQGQDEIPSDRAVFPSVLRPANRRARPWRRVVVQGPHKYVEGHQAYGDPKGLLFDLARSPDERKNLWSESPARVAALREDLRSYEQALDPIAPVHQTTGVVLTAVPGADGVEILDVPAAQAETLRQLGYLE